MPGIGGGVVLVALTLAGCADDGNDHALQAARLAERLAAERAATTVPAPTTLAPGEPAAAPTTVPAVTAATVVPTGVIVPIAALDNTFRPGEVTVQVGDEVVWENRGRNEHDVLSIEGVLADGTAWGVDAVDFAPGAIYSHVFTEPGEYRYYCTIHGNADVGMVGTVIVTA